jgi:hypothetical protein
VATLIVRNVDDAIVRALKKRAARRNHSAEQEHPEILEQALLRPKRRSLPKCWPRCPMPVKTLSSSGARPAGDPDDETCIWSIRTATEGWP